jgi:tRNA A-37 threonylcarbamoyl transferase component Bud32
MKTCPICETAYPNECAQCTADGAILVPTAELDPGTIIRDKYRIIRTLGRGGMGTVYLAEHRLLGRLRALKFMSGQLSRDIRFFNRFRQEARASVELRHPNIIEVVDLDQAEDGTPYMAMEFVDGPDLRQLLKNGPVHVPRALTIALGVARGLGAAHARGIIHRDLKPENILLAAAHTPHETPKLGDFGIAAMNDAATAVCQTQTLMLTPEYASPEQWRGAPGRELDGRADLYALGGVLYEMLTGNQAFSAANLEGWMYQHLHFEPPAPSVIRPELARFAGLDALVLSLLAKDRDRRTPSAEAAIAAFDGLLRPVTASGSRPVSIPPVPRAAEPAPAAAAARVTGPGVAAVKVTGPGVGSARITGPAAGARATDPARAATPNAGAGEARQARERDETRSTRRSIPIALSGFVALLLAAVLLAFGLPLTTVESVAHSLDRPDHSGPALLLHQLACSRGDGAACSVLGAAYFYGPGGESDPGRAAEFYSRACAHGDSTGCLASGSNYELGQGVTQNLTRAVEFYNRDCELGDPNGCAALGRMYESGSGVPQNYARAVSLFAKSCQAGSADGCEGLGRSYRDGHGVAIDLSMAASLFDKSRSLSRR